MIDPYYIILTPIFIAAVFYLIPYNKVKYPAVLVQTALLAAVIINYLFVRENGQQVISIGKFGPIALISYRCDIISSLLLVLTAFIFLALMIFNLPKEYMNSLFLFLMMVIQSLLMGIFISNDLFNIYVMYEVSIIVVSILIMFKKEPSSIYDGFMYLMINIVAMLFYLLGIGMLYRIFGSLDLLVIKGRMSMIQDPSSLIIPYSLIITAVSLKTALMPLFSWLPNAHASKGSPSIVSALLSGLYVKGSIYLFIRISDMFMPKIDMSQFFVVMGILTGIVGFILAVSQKDIKLILAYSTISQLGLIMTGINSMNEFAFYGSIYHILNHAFFKTALFLTAGIISDAYGTRNINRIKGLFKSMPSITFITLASILGITGAPLFNGSISKYMMQEAGSFADYSIMLINLGTIIIFIKYSSMFFGKSNLGHQKVNLLRTVTSCILSLMCFAGGIFGRELVSLLFRIHIDIHPLEYLDKSLIFLISLLAGYLIYSLLVRRSKLMEKVRRFELGFNDVCISIILFFIVTAAVTFLKH